MEEIVSARQQRRLEVVRCYHRYVRALRAHGLEAESKAILTTRKALASAIESACAEDPDLLRDFRRAFAARNSP